MKLADSVRLYLVELTMVKLLILFLGGKIVTDPVHFILHCLNVLFLHERIVIPVFDHVFIQDKFFFQIVIKITFSAQVMV